jgi:hypothetical protein
MMSPVASPLWRSREDGPPTGPVNRRYPGLDPVLARHQSQWCGSGAGASVFHVNRWGGGFSEATVLVAAHEIRVSEISPKHVQISLIGPRADGVNIPVLDLRLRRGQWHGTWDETGEQAGPFDSIRTVVAAISQALVE